MGTGLNKVFTGKGLIPAGVIENKNEGIDLSVYKPLLKKARMSMLFFYYYGTA